MLIVEAEVMNLPVAFVEKMQEILGNEFDDYIKCYEEKRLYGLRVNTKKNQCGRV